MTMPREQLDGVSVIVPCRNGAQRLPACLTALAAQTWEGPIEIIVVDDRSTDETAELAHAHGARVVRTQGTHGPAAARNAGIAQARHSLLAFTDDDAIPDPGWIAALLQTREATGAVAVAGHTVPSDADHLVCRYLAVNNPLAPLERGVGGHRHPLRRLRDYAAHTAGLTPEPTGRRPLYAAGTVNLLVDRGVLAALDGFDEDFAFSGEDQDLCRRLVRRHPDGLWFAPDAVVHHVFSPSLRDTLRRARAYARGNLALRRKHPEIGLVVFPVPLVWAAGTLALGVRAPRWVWLPTAALPAAYARLPREAWRRRTPEILGYAWLQFAEECAANVALVLPGRRSQR